MGALSEISKRLKTDIGELARASVDPAYSRQLTQANFRKDESKTRREESLVDQDKQRAQAIEDEQRLAKNRTQMLVMGKAADAGLSSGDWSPVARLVDSGELGPEAAHMGKLLIDSKLPQGFDYAYKLGKQAIDLNNSNARDIANQLKSKQIDSSQKQHAENLLLKKRKIEMEHAIDQRGVAEEAGDVSVIKDYFSNPDNLTQEERDRWLPMVTGDISSKQSINIMDAYLNERQRLNDAEAKKLSGRGSNQDIQTFKYFDTSLKRQSKPMTEAIRTIGELKQLLGQEPTGVTNKAITAKVSQLFDTNVRALANLQEWKNLGDIGQRIGGSVRNIVSGGRLESQYDDILQAISPYEGELVKARDLVKANIYDSASGERGFGVDPAKLFPTDWDQRYQVKKDPAGRTVRLDMWRKTVEYID